MVMMSSDASLLPGDQGDADRKPLSALLVSQLESSDTVIINKTDLVAEQKLMAPSQRFLSTKKHLGSI